jgi:protein-S-isoprenylcysteine O-methyltransferase Ste14
MKRSRKDLAFVSIQFLLFVLYLFEAPYPRFSLPDPVRIAGLCLACLGLFVTVKAIADLNRSLSPFPTPRGRGILITSGLYRWVRHPIYTGILVAALGYGIWSESSLKITVFVSLAVLLSFKARYEERLLIGRYPGYEDYMKQTGRFLPIP